MKKNNLNSLWNSESDTFYADPAFDPRNIRAYFRKMSLSVSESHDLAGISLEDTDGSEIPLNPIWK